jgi:hypothetical protein
MKLAAVLIALEAVASAQPQPDEPAPPAEPAPAEPAPTEPAPAGPSMSPPVMSPPNEVAVRMTNAARNAAARGKCALIDALDKRVRALDATYYEKVFATDPTIARCRPDVSPPGLVAVAAPPPRRLGLTIEGAVGLGLATAGGDGGSLYGLGGPALGFGGFVTPTVALSVRLSGALVSGGSGGGYGYIGVLGPSAQVWFNEHVWLGGGLGLAVLAACDDGCGTATGIGLDARLGYAFKPRGESGGNVSLETTYSSFGESDGPDTGLETVSLMIGFQSF